MPRKTAIKALDVDVPDIDERDSDVLRPAYNEAAKILLDYLTGKRAGNDVTKTCTQVVGNFGKIRGTESHTYGLKLMAERMKQIASQKLIDNK